MVKAQSRAEEVTGFLVPGRAEVAAGYPEALKLSAWQSCG